MRKIFLYIFLCFVTLFFIQLYSDAKKEYDPYYLYTEAPDKDISTTEYEKTPKPKDPRNFHEKVRETLHMKPSKKVYYHNLNKDKQPITEADYLILAQDIQRSEYKIPEPVYEKNPDIYIPDPNYIISKYNSPPGSRNMNLTRLVQDRVATSAGILSPDKTKMVYTSAYFYPRYKQTTSSAYNIPIKDGESISNALKKTNVIQQDMKPIVTVGQDNMQEFLFKTLFPLDWSSDSSKIAFKERIGGNDFGVWQTNIIVYNYKTSKWKKLTAVREAIKYWWLNNENVDLEDFMWDIYPLGWLKDNPNQIAVYAYAFTDSKPKFLGTWCVDADENYSELYSIDNVNIEIELHGYGLKDVGLR